MTFEALNDEQSSAVVGTPRIGVSQAAKWLICLVMALMCALWITPCAFAEGEGTLTENITDPQNLLGSNVSSVTDKIKETKQKAGVTVRLLYVESFGTEVKPTKWASGVLESLSPKPNTVLLAVASGDGKLVVVASGNSEDWLRNAKTMDALSEAATDKLAKSGAQDWSGAAIAMMDQIMLLKKTSTPWSMSKIAVIVLICVVAVLIVGTIVFVVLRNRHRRKEAELDAARAAAGKRTRANRRGHAVDYAAESKNRSRGKRSEEHGRRRRGEDGDAKRENKRNGKKGDEQGDGQSASIRRKRRRGKGGNDGDAGDGSELANAASTAEGASNGVGGESTANGAENSASAEPLFHAGDSFMPGDGSVDQSVSDDIESMFARPFIPGTQRPGDEDEHKDQAED